jgi:hypothetical protein
VIRMLASGPEDIWSLPSLVDVTVDKMTYLARVIKMLPAYDARLRAMECLPEGYHSIIKAALICLDAVKSMAINGDHPHSFISDSVFIALFRAAVKKVADLAGHGRAEHSSIKRRSSASSSSSIESDHTKSVASRRIPSALIMSRAESIAADYDLEAHHIEPVPASFTLVDPVYPEPPTTSSFLSAFIPLLSASLTPTRTQALRVMVSLHALGEKALNVVVDSEQPQITYSRAELLFTQAVFEQGVMGFGAEGALAMAGLLSFEKRPSTSPTKQSGEDVAAEEVPYKRTPSKMFLSKVKKAVHAAAMSKIIEATGKKSSDCLDPIEDEEEVEEEVPTPVPDPDPSHVATWLAFTSPRVHWLEKLFPQQDVFKGIESAIKSNPDIWHHALNSSSLLCGYVRDGEGVEDDTVAPYSWRRKLGSLHWLLLVAVAAPHRISVACESLLCSPVLGGPHALMTPGDTLLVALQSTPASCPLLLTTTGCSDALDAIRQAQSCFAAGHSPLSSQPEDIGLQSTQVTIKHWDASDITSTTEARDKAVAEVHKAIKDHRWLVILNAHSAPTLILDVIHTLSLSSYLIRGEGARSFRLFLATPHPSLFLHPNNGIPLTVRAKAMRVVLGPFWGSMTAMGAATGSGSSTRISMRAACQTLAHPHASYLGFYNKVGPKGECHRHDLSDDLMHCRKRNRMSKRQRWQPSLPCPPCQGPYMHQMFLKMIMISDSHCPRHEPKPPTLHSTTHGISSMLCSPSSWQ